MKVVMIMYDSLNKRYLSPYGNNWMITPNFQRLASHTVTFDNFFGCSFPCMPARRELQTGRPNFLHRSWGPSEPFDESMPEMLASKQIYSHLITDHCHYWEAGGANYWIHFSSFSFVRGQEGDKWSTTSVDGYDGVYQPRKQDIENRKWMSTEEKCSHVRCFEKGKDFIIENQDKDNWFLQLEYFDPHEPFFVPERFKKMYTEKDIPFDWPEYRRYDESEKEKVNDFIMNYAALVTMCDEYLGRILDIFDEYDLWKDTMLLVNTDHGFMLGEKGYVGKNYMPVYDEVANIPFFIHDPRHPELDGTRTDALAQTPDIPCTILDIFGVQKGKHMTGKSMLPVLEKDEKIHDALIYGYFGMHVNVTDGHYTYMRAGQTEKNTPLFQYTLMPCHIQKPMQIPEIKNAEDMLCREFEFTEYTPVLKIPVDERYDKKRYYKYSTHEKYGTMLFDRIKDPMQEKALEADDIECEMIEKMITLMKEAESPEEQYVRLGLINHI